MITNCFHGLEQICKIVPRCKKFQRIVPSYFFSLPVLHSSLGQDQKFSLFSEPVFLHLLCQNFVVHVDAVDGVDAVDAVDGGVDGAVGDDVVVGGEKDGDLKSLYLI